MQTKIVKVKGKEPVNEHKNFENMFDSEFLAYFLAQIVKEDKHYISEYTFQRLDGILETLAKAEMN